MMETSGLATVPDLHRKWSNGNS